MHSEATSISTSKSKDLIQEIESEETLDDFKKSYKFSNGCVFIGNLSDGKKAGYGTFILLNGDLYEGNWINDKLEGYGLYRYGAGYELRAIGSMIK